MPTNQQNNTQDDFDFQVKLLEFKMGVLCPLCNAKVIDPDKKKNQTHLKDRCPSCGLDPVEEARRMKKERKQRIKAKNKGVA